MRELSVFNRRHRGGIHHDIVHPARPGRAHKGIRALAGVRKDGAARKAEPVRKTWPVPTAQERATRIFRDFVRQLEKLDGRPRRDPPAKGGADDVPRGRGVPSEIKLLSQPAPTHRERMGSSRAMRACSTSPILGKDVVVPGAFRDCLATHGASAASACSGSTIRPEPVGRWLAIRGGPARTARARQTQPRGRAGARHPRPSCATARVDGLSIGFRIERARSERPTGLRRLEKLDLWEISIVTFPMLPGARVETVKQGPTDLADTIRRTSLRLFS